MVSQGDRRGYRHILEEFWEEAESHGVPLKTPTPVSAAAFCKARRGIRPGLLRELLHRVARETDRDAESEELRWKGRRVFAVDGTKVTVRRSPELWQHFGSATGSHYPQATVSALSDVLTGVTHDVQLSPYASSERDALLELLPRLNAGDLIILDRGYPSFEVLDALHRSSIDFVIRVPRNVWREVREFADGKDDDSSWNMTLPRAKDGRSIAQEIPLRLVRCARDEEDPVILITSLPVSEANRSEMDELYHLRWGIEETYKLRKGLYLNQRQMHSMTVEGVEQEILALHLFIGLARTMRRAAAHQADEHPLDLSQKGAMLCTGGSLVPLALACLSRPKAWIEVVTRVLARIARQIDRRRPGRAFPRRSFQPGQRWRPTGRNGT